MGYHNVTKREIGLKWEENVYTAAPRSGREPIVLEFELLAFPSHPPGRLGNPHGRPGWQRQKARFASF